LLCSSCNFLVGLVETKWGRIMEAREYLEKYELND
jgi:hypothetical protein